MKSLFAKNACQLLNGYELLWNKQNKAY